MYTRRSLLNYFSSYLAITTLDFVYLGCFDQGFRSDLLEQGPSLFAEVRMANITYCNFSACLLPLLLVGKCIEDGARWLVVWFLALCVAIYIA